VGVVLRAALREQPEVEEEVVAGEIAVGHAVAGPGQVGGAGGRVALVEQDGDAVAAKVRHGEVLDPVGVEIRDRDGRGPVARVEGALCLEGSVAELTLVG